jgi:hypothetical protein
MRVVYMDLRECVKPSPRQDFSIMKRQLKYAEIPAELELIAEINKSQKKVDIGYLIKTSFFNFSTLQNFNFLSKKILMENISNNIKLSKQGKWA